MDDTFPEVVWHDIRQFTEFENGVLQAAEEFATKAKIAKKHNDALALLTARRVFTHTIEGLIEVRDGHAV